IGDVGAGAGHDQIIIPGIAKKGASGETALQDIGAVAAHECSGQRHFSADDQVIVAAATFELKAVGDGGHREIPLKFAGDVDVILVADQVHKDLIINRVG